MSQRISDHVPALITIIVWGSTFVVSKGLIEMHIPPVLLITVRFILAYCFLCIVCPKPAPLQSAREELKLLASAITGGSLYFILEYSSLERTSAVNTGLITSTVPILTTLILILFTKKQVRRLFFLGSSIAIIGSALIVTNGQWSLQAASWGDLLSLLSCLSWAIYSVVLGSLSSSIPRLQATRRIFLYSAITILPFTIASTTSSDLQSLLCLQVALPLAYLGIIASGLCLYLWHRSFASIGVILTNNYLYLQPLVAFLCSLAFRGGEITPYKCLGSLLIMVGIILADKYGSAHTLDHQH